MSDEELIFQPIPMTPGSREPVIRKALAAMKLRAERVREDEEIAMAKVLASEPYPRIFVGGPE